jgi:uncharacterized short protein YbdD (DUF466 family)
VTGVRGRTGVRRWLAVLHWYLREITGEADYDHYLARAGDAPVMSRREFEQRRWADQERTPGNRCC